MASTNDRIENETTDEQESSRGTVEALVRNAAAREAERATWAPTKIDGDTVLARKAQQMGLGEVKTGELSISWAGTDYILQGFTGGILYAEDGQPDTARRIGWGTTRDAMEQGKTEGAATSLAGMSLGGEPAGDHHGDQGDPNQRPQ